MTQGLQGLTDDEIVRLERDRANLLRDMALSTSGRRLLRRGDIDTDMTANAGVSLLDDLAERMTSSDSRVRVSATIALADTGSYANLLIGPEHYVAKTRPFRLMQDLHRYLNLRIRRKNLPDGESSRFPHWWGWISSLVALVASGIVLMDAVAPSRLWAMMAAALVVFRVVVTIQTWRTAYPGDDSPDHPVLAQDHRQCALGHFTDLMMFGAIAVHLMHQTHWITGIMVIVSTQLMVTATVMRQGAGAPRLHAEQVLRAVSSMGAVVALGLNAWVVAVIFGALPLLPAIVEGIEAWSKSSSQGPSGSGWDATPGNPMVPSSLLDDQIVGTPATKMLL